MYKGDEIKDLVESKNLDKEDIQKTEDNKSNNVSDEKSVAKKETLSLSNSGINLCLLGEIMLGGEVSNNLELSYVQAIKNVYINTRFADFTYANFSTNIVSSTEEKEKSNSKYLVLDDAVKFLQALGLDAVSIASEHIVDVEKDKLNFTQNILESNGIKVAGKKDTPIYFEKNGKKVAIISTNSVFTYDKARYDDYLISTFEKNNLQKNIKEAKKFSDVVIVDIHAGNEYEYKVTDNMKYMATFAIDSGADMVIGSHALGVYPIVTYKSCPIIYSLGYFISDTDMYVGKESYIFNVYIDNDGKISSFELIPIYINDKKEVLMYEQYNKEKCTEYLEQFNSWNKQNGLDSKIQDNKIIINF